MGWLHDGHRALMRQARAADATTVVTIFVNPRQFNVAADFTKYPRNEARDLAICEAEGVDLVFAPEPIGGLPARLRHGRVGRARSRGRWRARPGPGHFDGVATVVAILFDLVGAEHAYFGQKDAQQVMVIRQMARDLAIADRGHRLPDRPRSPTAWRCRRGTSTCRPAERAAAPVLHRALLAARARWEAGERSAEALRAVMRDELAARAAGRRRVRLGGGRRDPGRARSGRRAGAAVAGRPVRDHPPHRQRAAGRPRRRRPDGRPWPPVAGSSSPTSSTSPRIGAAFPYLPVFYRDLGLTLAEIGVLTAIQAAVQLLLAPVWGGLADRFPRIAADPAAGGRRRDDRGRRSCSWRPTSTSSSPARSSCTAACPGSARRSTRGRSRRSDRPPRPVRRGPRVRLAGLRRRDGRRRVPARRRGRPRRCSGPTSRSSSRRSS